MSQTDPKFAPFVNHIDFLSKHRGRLTTEPNGIWIRGPIAELTTWTPAPLASEAHPDCPAVRLAPWCSTQWNLTVRDAGFVPGERLSYMELVKPTVLMPSGVGITISVVRSLKEAQAFADVQSSGFATGKPEVDDWWAPFFHEVAAKNYLDHQQTFYLANCDGVPAATTLVVRSAGVLGVYAVATRPEFRRRGLAGALLERVRTDAACEGSTRIILQAMSGSYAQTYYEKLGFRRAYELTVWRRPR